MAEHKLNVVQERGDKESRVRFLCSCGVAGPDRGWKSGDPASRRHAFAAVDRDHKLHAEGRDKEITEGDPSRLPGAPYRPPDA